MLGQFGQQRSFWPSIIKIFSVRALIVLWILWKLLRNSVVLLLIIEILAQAGWARHYWRWSRGHVARSAEVIPITIPIIKPGHSAEQPLPGSHTTRPHCIGDPITLTCYSSASWCPYQCIFIYYYLPVGYFNYYWVFCNVSSINRSIRY